MRLNQWARRLPWSILILANLILALGWLGIARCENLTGGGPYLRLQMVWSTLALAAMLLVTLPSYRVLCRFSYGIFALSLALLVLVYLFPPVNGARRWIRLGPLGLQPSEFAKIAYVMALARYLTYRDNYRRLSGLWLPLGLTCLPVGLILREPDLGTSLVFLPVLFVMLFAAGARRWHLGALLLAGVLSVPGVWAGMSLDQQSRVTALFEQSGPGEPITPRNYQLRQAKQVMALGGWWGSLAAGPASEDSAAYRLPEARSDFIFCILAERLGLAGIALLLLLYGLLIWRGLEVAVATREPFGRLAAVGLTFLIAVQVLINTGMNVGLLPITGISLPLVSYGGSGLLSEGILVGLLLNIGLRPGFEVTAEPFRYVER